MTQPQRNKLGAQEWIKKAEEDELSLKTVLVNGAPSTACFLAQQMAEKYLKGLLVFYGQSFPKIHDLKRIATLLEPFVPDIFDLEGEFNNLNKFYAATRYPGDIPEGFGVEDAKLAFEAALRVKEFSLKIIYQESNA